MPKKYAASTIGHVETAESRARFHELCAKWPKWRISAAEHKLIDLSECRMIGAGRQEIGAFTFARHVRVGRLRGEAFPVWLSAGPHWSDRWHDAQGRPVDESPLIAIPRGLTGAAGLVEPLRMLAVGSCANAPFVYDDLLRRLSAAGWNAEPARGGNPRCRLIVGDVPALLAALEASCGLTCPSLEWGAPSSSASVTVTFEDVRPWDEFRQKQIEPLCPMLGNGGRVVYAFTFEALAIAAELAAEPFYPVKVGHTSIDHWPTAYHAAVHRIVTQCPFTEAVRILGLLSCEDGRTMEREAHRRLEAQRILAPAREWFLTDASTIAEIFRLLA